MGNTPRSRTRRDAMRRRMTSPLWQGKMLRVACPFCKAPVGTGCGRDARRIKMWHAARFLAAGGAA